MRNDLIALALCLGKEQYHNDITAKTVKTLKCQRSRFKALVSLA